MSAGELEVSKAADSVETIGHHFYVTGKCPL